MSARHAGALALLLLPAAAHAGAFIFAEEGDEDSITHPAGYTGNGGPRTLAVCLRTATLPSGVSATQVENTVLKAIATWNAQRVASANLGLVAENDIPAGALDFESVLLHEMGHCLGLAHPNHASESGLTGAATNGTKSTDGGNGMFNQGAGTDALHGSSDDVRGDDGNLYWYHVGSNDPLAFPALIDATTFRVTPGGLPAGHLFARNGDRDVLAALGVARTESVMQQGQFSDEAQRRLTAEDLATIRLGQAGLDELQGTADDYTLALTYAGRVQDCDITVEFNAASSFAFCEVGGSGIGTTDHVRVTSSALVFSPTTNWFFSPAPNTSTAITADTPDPSPPGGSYAVTAAVAVTTAAPVGPASGDVEIADDAGNRCIATLASGSGSCNLSGSPAGTRTLRATYLGFRGFDASTSTPSAHVVGGGAATLTLSESPATSVVGQPYTVGATVAGSGSTPTGSVAVDDGRGASCTITLTGGSGNCQIATTSAGNVTLTGAYAGNATYGPDTDTEAHAVNPAASRTTIVSRVPAATVVGQAYTVNVALAALAPGAGLPPGPIAISDGNGNACSATLVGGSGGCVLPSSGAGTLTLAADYAGNADFSASNATTPHVVSRAATQLSIQSDAPDASAPGQSVTVAFVLQPVSPGAGTPSGSVVVSASGGSESCTVVLPQASCELVLNVAGARTLGASYGGDARFAPSSDGESHVVAGATTTTTIVAASPQPSRVGEMVSVSASVAPVPPALGTPGGSITVDTGVAGESCTMLLPATSCSLALLRAGARVLTARYSGDGSFAASDDSQAQAVLPAQTASTIVALQPALPRSDQSYVVSVGVATLAPGAGTPSGNVTIDDGAGASCSAALVAGAMGCTLVPTAPGPRTLGASYAGTADFVASSTSTAVTVRAVSALSILSTPQPSPRSASVAVTIGLPTAAGVSPPSGDIAVSTDRQQGGCTITLPDVACALTLDVPGTHRLRAAYAGDANYTDAAVVADHVVSVARADQVFVDGFEAPPLR